MPAPRRHVRRLAAGALLLALCAAALFYLIGDRETAPRVSPVAAPRDLSSPSSTAALAPPSAPAVLAAAPEPLPVITREWLNQHFPGFRILEQRQTARDSAGNSVRELLLETSFKYPLIEVAEHLELDRDTGADAVRMRVAAVADHLLLKPLPGLSATALQTIAGKFGATVDRALLAEAGLVRVQLPKAQLGAVKAAVAQLTRSGAIADYAEPDYLFFTQATPNDPDYAQQTALHNPASPETAIGAEAAWGIRTSAADIRVAIIDTGIRYTHVDLRSNMWKNPAETLGNGLDDDGNGWVDDIYGANFYGNTADPIDEAGHGTHVAGILGARGNDGQGITGVAWQVQMMALRFQSQYGSGTASDAVRAVNYAVAKGAHIINASWGGFAFSQALSDAIAAAGDAGILFVAAAGNHSLNTDSHPLYPSCYELENIVCVGALDGIYRNYGSNYGAQSVDLFAPGTLIYSLGDTSDTAYVKNSGTSMATPFVSGALALLKAHFPGSSYPWLKDRLLKTTVPVASVYDWSVTQGRVDLYQSLANIVRPPAVITQQPVGASGDDGDSVTLSAAATGGGKLRYQWYHGSTLLKDQTSATLTLANLTEAEAGEYHVVVSNFSSTITSETVVVTVTHTPPILTSALAEVVALAGQPVNFAPTFKGSRPMQFQWERDGARIEGATNSTFSLERAKAADAGDYRVKATNAYGSVYFPIASLSFAEHYLERWSQTLPVPTDANYFGVAYLNGGFVAVGDEGTIVTSATGAAWQLTAPATTAQLRAVTYGGGRYVAVGKGGVIVTSTDGQVWTAVASGSTDDLVAVAYGAGTFVALGSSRALVSADGLTWSPRAVGTATRLQQIAFGNGVFLATALGSSNLLQAWSSADGVTWSVQAFREYSNAAALHFSDGTFWLGDGDWIYSSTDALTWRQRRRLTPGSFIAQSGYLYTVTRDEICRALFDGDYGDREQLYFNRETYGNSMAAGAGRIVVVGYGGSILYCEDGRTFNDVTRFVSEHITPAVRLNGQFVISTNSGKILASPDGITWSQTATIPVETFITGLVAGKGLLIATDYYKNHWTSPDAVQWTKRTTPVTDTSSPYGLTFHGDSFWLSTYVTPAYRSADGINWTPLDIAPTLYGGGRYLRIDFFKAQWSDDGVTWQNSSRPPEYAGPACYASGAFYMLAAGRLLTSKDGIDWTISAPIRGFKYGDSPESFGFQDGIFFASGYSGFYLSLDGVTWALQGVPAVFRFISGDGLLLAQARSSYESTMFRSAAADALPFTAPGTVTSAVSDLTHRRVLLRGTVNAGGAVTSIAFEFGTTANLGQAVNLSSFARGRIDRAFSATLADLQPGTEYFYRITATNSAGTATGETLTFTTAANRPPVAQGDGPFQLHTAAASTLSVLTNDSEPDGDAITIAEFTQGRHGTVARSGASVSYTPAPGSFGRDEFTYTIEDEFGARATATVTLHASPRPPAPVRKILAVTGADAPGAGTSGGPPAGAKLAGFGTPALSDLRQAAATVTLSAGNRLSSGILYHDENGASSLPAFSGAPAPGAAGATFQSFSNPVLSPNGALAFLAKTGRGAAAAAPTQGIWSRATGGSLALALKVGDRITGPGTPRPVAVLGVTTVAFHGETLYAVAQLAPLRATALIRIDANGPVLVTRDGAPLETGITIKKLTVFQPAQGSPGAGRWIGSDGIIARAALSDRSSALLKIAPNGTVNRLASTGIPSLSGGGILTSFGLPALGGGSEYAVSAMVRGITGRLLVLDRLGYGGLWPAAGVGYRVSDHDVVFSTLGEPVLNRELIAFTGTVAGAGVTRANSAGIWCGFRHGETQLARLGEPAPDAKGEPGPKWHEFTSLALPLGPGSGPIVLGKVRTATAAVPGLWALDSTGVFRQLLAAGENTIGDTTLDITAISTLAADAGAFGVARSYNGNGSIAVRVTTAARTQALLRVDIP